jgi:hypothetical protein
VTAGLTTQDGAADAARMKDKVQAIIDRAEDPTRTYPQPLRTAFTEREVNAYFKVYGPEFLPNGVVDPEVTIEGAGRLRARAVVDLDAALKEQRRGLFNPLAWLPRRTEVTAVGTVRAAEGVGVLELERATLGGVPVPKTLLQLVVSYYTRTPESPEGFNIDKPFELPSNIRSVSTAPGRATVEQP